MNLKTSVTLDTLVNLITIICQNHNYDYMDAMSANAFVTANENKYRSDHFAVVLTDGIRLAEKSYNLGKPIYQVYHKETDVIYYMVGDLADLKAKLTKILKTLQKEAEADDRTAEENEIIYLKQRLSTLTTKKKKK